MYLTTIQSVQGTQAVDIKGRILRIAGNDNVTEGKQVWTDGKVIYGHHMAGGGSSPYIPQGGYLWLSDDGIYTVSADLSRVVLLDETLDTSTVTDMITRDNFVYADIKGKLYNLITGEALQDNPYLRTLSFKDYNIDKEGRLLAMYHKYDGNNQYIVIARNNEVISEQLFECYWRDDGNKNLSLYDMFVHDDGSYYYYESGSTYSCEEKGKYRFYHNKNYDLTSYDGTIHYNTSDSLSSTYTPGKIKWEWHSETIELDWWDTDVFYHYCYKKEIIYTCTPIYIDVVPGDCLVDVYENKFIEEECACGNLKNSYIPLKLPLTGTTKTEESGHSIEGIPTNICYKASQEMRYQDVIETRHYNTNWDLYYIQREFAVIWVPQYETGSKTDENGDYNHHIDLGNHIITVNPKNPEVSKWGGTGTTDFGLTLDWNSRYIYSITDMTYCCAEGNYLIVSYNQNNDGKKFTLSSYSTRESEEKVIAESAWVGTYHMGYIRNLNIVKYNLRKILA